MGGGDFFNNSECFNNTITDDQKILISTVEEYIPQLLIFFWPFYWSMEVRFPFPVFMD